MAAITTAERMMQVIEDRSSPPALQRIAKLWIQVNDEFTDWIHEFAKKQMSDDEYLTLLEKQESYDKEEEMAWRVFVQSRSSERAATLIMVLESTIQFRRDQMNR